MDELVVVGGKLTSFSDYSMPIPSSSWFPRRPSVEPTAKFKPADRPESSLARAYVDDFGSRSSESSPSISHSAPLLHSHFEDRSSPLPSRHRTSIFSAASDAFGLRRKIGSVTRKKPVSPTVVPEVIEISARNNTIITASVAGTTAYRDCECEERERLRDVAAQSIGLGPELLHDSYRSESCLSLDSLQSHSQLPPFPATLAALRPFTKLTASFPKFTPSSSLLLYALAKQWRHRTIVLSSHSPSQKTHAHLFKGTSDDEKELERLEVTEDSVIFVLVEDVGGRANVVKFTGRDCSAKRSGEDSMWFLQITDPAESQRWIADIKSAVLMKRAVRAGLDFSAQSNDVSQPRGDGDGVITLDSVKPSPSPPIPVSPSPPASLRSVKVNIPSSPSPITTVKGIFSGTRPRSPSVDGSTALSHSPGRAEDSFGIAGTSLLTMLRTKSSADSGSSRSHSLPLPLPYVPGKGSPAPSLRSTNTPVVISASDLRISRDRDTPDLPTALPETRLPIASPVPSFADKGILTLSLQPPPRKSKYAATTSSAPLLPEQKTMYKQAGGNRSVAGNFGISSRGSGDDTPRETSPVSPDSPSFSARSDSFPPSASFKASSLSVNEAYGSGENDGVAPTLQGNRTINPTSLVGESTQTDKPLQSRVYTRRWSRQGVTLPRRPSPPSGPPPSIPPSLEDNHRNSVESSISISVTYTADPSPSTSSFNPQGGSSLSPAFWKRTSTSSAYSAGSTSTSQSQVQSLLPTSSSGEFFPSSFRSVASNGTSTRPMSFSIPSSSPVAHVTTTKRRSMPPPRPAPNFAPPPIPTIQESAIPGPSTLPASAPQRSLRSSVALRLSMTSPKPPPSSALPPRPDEPAIVRGHRRRSSTGPPEFLSVPTPTSRPSSTYLGNTHTDTNTNASTSSTRGMSIRQRLRILSTPPTSLPPIHSPSSLMPPLQVSSLDLSDDNDDDLPTPHVHSPQPFRLGEHILTTRNDTSFLTTLPNIPKPPPRSPFRTMPLSSNVVHRSGLATPPLEHCDFVSLSPPPRRGSKHRTVVATRTENVGADEPGSTRCEESALLPLSQHGSVVSLGFVTS